MTILESSYIDPLAESTQLNGAAQAESEEERGKEVQGKIFLGKMLTDAVGPYTRVAKRGKKSQQGECTPERLSESGPSILRLRTVISAF